MYSQVLILTAKDLTDEAQSVEITAENVLDFYKGSMKPIFKAYLVLYITNDTRIVIKNSIFLDDIAIQKIVMDYFNNEDEFYNSLEDIDNEDMKESESSNFCMSGLNFFG